MVLVIKGSCLAIIAQSSSYAWEAMNECDSRTNKVNRRYPGVVGGRHDDVLATELLEELGVVLLLRCVRATEDLLQGRPSW